MSAKCENMPVGAHKWGLHGQKREKMKPKKEQMKKGVGGMPKANFD